MQDKDILQLVNQDSFLNYCFNRNNEDVTYWKEWLVKNPEHKQQIEELRQMLILMGEESRKKNNDENFAELQKRIVQSKPDIATRPYPFLRKWSIAAAAVLMVVGAGLFFYNKNGNDQKLAKVNDVSPGGNKAVLILANGERVNLTLAANGAVANQSGIKIIKAADGQLIYDMSDVSMEASSDVYNTIETPIGGQYQVNLSDGTKVWLNAGSSLRYPLKFAKNERRVELKGEGYFEVKHQKGMPFKVSSYKQTVEVLGTHFNIMAYADEAVTRTTLLEGSVEISGQNSKTLLSPGQQARLVNDKINVTEDVDLEDVVAWKNGYFKFNESLVSIMSKISRWYGVEVIYQTKPNPSLTYSGKISRTRNISAVLKMIEFNGDVRFKVEGRKIYVTE